MFHKYHPIHFRLRRFMNIFLLCLMKIYHAHVHSLISYCILVYISHSDANINLLENFQARILKMIFRTLSKELRSIIQKYKILTCSQIVKYKLLCFGHSIIITIISVYWQEMKIGQITRVHIILHSFKKKGTCSNFSAEVKYR